MERSIWSNWDLCACVTIHQYLQVSKSWRGGSPTLDRDRSSTRLCCYIYNFKYSLPAPSVSTVFWIFLVPYSLIPPNHQQPLIVLALSLYVAPAPHVIYQRKAPPTWTLSTPATHQPPPLVSAPRSTCLFMLLFPVIICLRPGTCHPLGGLPVTGPSISPVPLPLPPWVLFLIPVSSGYWYLCQVDFGVRARGQESSIP